MPQKETAQHRRHLMMVVVAFVLVLLVFESGARTLFGPVEQSGVGGLVVRLRQSDPALLTKRVLVTGSSHMQTGVARQTWPEALVLAHGSQDLHNDHALVEVCRGLQNVDTLVIGVDHHSLGYALDRSDRYLSAQYRAAGLPLRTPSAKEEAPSKVSAWMRDFTLRRSTFLRYQPIFLRESLKALLKHIPSSRGSQSSSLSSAQRPFATPHRTADAMNMAALQRARLHFQVLFDEKVRPSATESLVSLTRHAQSRGWRVMWATAPLSAAYRNAAGKRLRQERAKLRQLADRLSVPWVDDSASAAFSVTDFTDPDHLTAASAVRWTQMVRAQLSELAPAPVIDAQGRP